ncbi:MAG: hypothetical protein CSA70_03935 [Rhodobacterales bacterium]|nr:MAG: hypothetical protein CSA70_03935 [Rhodobacterales bacterium]
MSDVNRPTPLDWPGYRRVPDFRRARLSGGLVGALFALLALATLTRARLKNTPQDNHPFTLAP